MKTANEFSLEKFTTEKVPRQTLFVPCYDNPYSSLSIIEMKGIKGELS
jgi:hypothetical protein